MIGLLLWHEEARDKEALACTTRIGDLFCKKYLGRKKTRLVGTGCHGDEPGSGARALHPVP